MTPELGHFALILALFLALSQTLLPTLGVFRNSELLMSSARSLAVGLLVMLSVAFGVLAHAFLTNDFSVAIVSSQSNS